MKYYYVYILKCADNSFYTGMTNDLERRLIQHQSGKTRFSYTARRLPVSLVWYLQCTNPNEAIRIEKQIKGWSHRKKKALIDENWNDLITFSRNYTEFGNRIKEDQSYLIDRYERLFVYWDSKPHLKDLRWLAYILATTYHETGREIKANTLGRCRHRRN